MGNMPRLGALTHCDGIAEVSRMIKHFAYSYLEDPAVPKFQSNGVFSVMDAHCALCARGATWIARHDRRGEFSIIPVQSDLGASLMRHYGLDPADPSSWLYVEEGKAHSSLDALIRVGQRFGGRWRALALLHILPKPVRDFVYRTVATNRYRWFGRADLCNLPDPEVQKRLLA